MSFKTIAWITDPHFDQCDISKIETLIKDIKKQKADAVLITGDIAEKGTTGLYLQFLQRGLKLPVWFVLGNHDWYNISRERGEEILSKYLSDDLVLLDNIHEIKLNKKSCLVGGENWWDAAFSDTFGLIDGYVMGEDYQKIDYIAPQTNNKSPFDRVRKISNSCSEKIVEKLIEAFKNYDKVYLAVHVPPFKEACVVSGIQIPNNWLNHFCDYGLGDKLKQLMTQYPEKKLKVLAGHTHGKITVKVLDNLTVKVGKAKVGKPQIADIIEI